MKKVLLLIAVVAVLSGCGTNDKLTCTYDNTVGDVTSKTEYVIEYRNNNIKKIKATYDYKSNHVDGVGTGTDGTTNDKDDNKADVAGTYAGTLGVTLDGEGPISSSQSIELTSPADNKINFVLKNFILQAGMGGEAGQSVPVGNIKITDIDLVGTNGNYTFTKTANIKIEAGDKEGIASDAWMGPIISGTSGIPVTLKGTITGNDIKLDITIPFMNMNIAVQFSGAKK